MMLTAKKENGLLIQDLYVDQYACSSGIKDVPIYTKKDLNPLKSIY